MRGPITDDDFHASLPARTGQARSATLPGCVMSQSQPEAGGVVRSLFGLAAAHPDSSADAARSDSSFAPQLPVVAKEPAGSATQASLPAGDILRGAA